MGFITKAPPLFSRLLRPPVSRRLISTQTKNEFFYWPIPALGEPIRLSLTIGGIPFTDNTPQNCADFDAKKEAAGCQVPFLTVDGKVMSQSKSILRYVGKHVKYEGKTLYPTDPMEAFKCDEMMDFLDDMRKPFASTFALPEEERPAARAAILAEDGALTKEILKLEKRLETFGPSLTVADLLVFSFMNAFRQPTFVDGIPEGTLDKYANINKHHEFVANLPPIAEHYKNAEGLLQTFKPFNQ
mmetsp:Transcript_97162/g.173077  ORF Transcript_97162/g.173077 Transcript_97162/m.173077 type:complete len:243 (-) Transcript_97162:78-806(-)